MLDTIMLAVSIGTGAAALAALIRMHRMERRTKHTDAPVPFADYDRANPINQGGGRWHPSRVREMPREEPSGFRYIGTSEFGTEWYEAVPMGGLK